MSETDWDMMVDRIKKLEKTVLKLQKQIEFLASYTKTSIQLMERSRHDS